jgi:hypothetical protein
VGSLKMNTTLEYSTRVVQEGDRRCKKSTLNDLAYLTPLRIPLMNPVIAYFSANVSPRLTETLIKPILSFHNCRYIFLQYFFFYNFYVE